MNLTDLIQKALAGFSLTPAELARVLTNAALKLPPGATQDEVNLFVDTQLANVLSVTRLAQLALALKPLLVQFFTTGSGAVGGAPTDVAG